MLSHHTGSLKSGWALSALTSFRKGDSGFIEGTNYQAISGLVSVEKTWNKQHASWLTTWWTPTSRGRNAPLTQEVFRLKGKQYNPYWGRDQGRLRNARMHRSSVPYFILNHSIDFGPKFHLAFRYTGSGKTASDGTYEIDDIRVFTRQ